LPNALSARTHGHPHAGNPLAAKPAKGLAKASAGAATLANPITRQDLVGFWNMQIVDTSDTSYRYYDSSEVYFGNNGEYETRSKSTEVPLTDGEVYTSSSQEKGTWALTDTGLVMGGHNCRYIDSDTIFSQDTCLSSETLPMDGWEIKTTGGRKVWTMPIDYGNNTPSDTSFLYYVSAEPHFTLPNLLPTSLAPGKTHSQLRQAKAFSFYPGNRVVSPQALLDLRGKSIAPGRQAQGLYYSAGNSPGR